MHVPIYEYRCNDCDLQFEVMQSMSDEPLAMCQECGGQVSRVLFAPAIHFKGKGFHNTDYGTKRRPVGGEGDGGGGDKSKAGGDGAGAAKSGDSGTSSTSSSGDSGSSKTIGLDKA